MESKSEVVREQQSGRVMAEGEAATETQGSREAEAS